MIRLICVIPVRPGHPWIPACAGMTVGQAVRGNDPRLHGDRLPTSRHWLGVVYGGWWVESEDAVLVEVEAVVEDVQVSHASGGGEDLLFGHA